MEIGQIRGSLIPLSLRNLCGHVPNSFTLSLSSITPTSTKSEKRMFILGIGFVGKFLATNSTTKDRLCLTLAQAKQLEDMGFHVHLFYANHPEEVYNIMDDDPAPQEEVFEYARKWWRKSGQA